MSFHKDEVGSSIHVLHAFTYANAAARLAATGLQSTDIGKVALQSDNNTYYILIDDSPLLWQQIGSGAGSGGINFVGLDSNFAPSNADDRDAENSIGNWVAYKDAAGATPVDMTGGSPTVSIARTTTSGEILNGSASFEITKDAANRQGEGVSVVANVPLAYRNVPSVINIPFKINSGSFVGGDLKVFVYDVTNSLVITPQGNDVVGASGVIRANIGQGISGSQVRLGFHFASTSATAVTLSFDDVSFGPGQAISGLAGTELQSYTPATTGFGTITSSFFSWARVGNHMILSGTFVSGTTTAVAPSISLPNGLSIDFSTIGSSVQLVGKWAEDVNTADVNVLADPSDPSKLFFESTNNAAPLVPSTNATLTFSSTKKQSFFAKFPIAGWNSNLSLASSATYRASDFLATGTRVTGTAPTALGEYRSYLRDAGAATYTETSGAPTASPSVADGMLLYGGNGSASADSNNEPSRYEIFVGKRKNVKWEFYSSAARTGNASPDVLISGTNSIGCHYGYDPSTGIAWITNFVVVGSSTAQFAAVGSTVGAISDVYFDVIVSENALGVGIDERPTALLSSTAGTLSVTANSPIIWDNVLYQSGAYDTATGLFMAPSSGLYLIVASIQWGTNGTAQVYVNNVARPELLSQNTYSTGFTAPINIIIKVNAGDTFFVSNGVSQTIGGTGASHMEIIKVSN